MDGGFKFGLGPKMWEEDGCLRLRSNRFIEVLLLWSHSRKLTVDPTKRHLYLHVKYGWFFTFDHDIPFDRIAYIDTDTTSSTSSSVRQ